MDDKILIETIPEIIKETLLKIKAKNKKEYTMEKFLEDVCKCWTKLSKADQDILSKIIVSEDFPTILENLK